MWAVQELTGSVPTEIQLIPGRPTPTIRKRVGTEFTISPKLLNSDDVSHFFHAQLQQVIPRCRSDDMSYRRCQCRNDRVVPCVCVQGNKTNDLEVEFEILQKQMEATLKLSQDKSLSRAARRTYRQQYKDTHLKVRPLHWLSEELSSCLNVLLYVCSDIRLKQ